MSTNKKPNSEFLETLKSNYKQRIKEVDNFSRKFSNSSADFRSQYLSGLSDLLQYYIDLQKKFTKGYPQYYDNDLMTEQSKKITEVWTSNFRSMDMFYSMFLDYTRNSMRFANSTFLQMMQFIEKFYDMNEGVTPISKNTLIDLIKEAKKYNDHYLQNQIPKKNKSKLNNGNKISLKQTS